MPAETRRTRKASGDDELELKRARGEISCAECRRLKLKCDKKLPCGSCVRRGCTTICPNGSLSAGQGTRFVLADTEQLHRKIAEMSERIRQLEDALAIFQAGVSNERHPLLRDELLTVKFGPEVRRTVDEENSRDQLSHSIDALGTLTIGDHGETKYFGRSGGSEMLLTGSPIETDANDSPSVSLEVANLSASFPFSVVENGIDAFLDKLESFLPPQPRAWALCEAYLEHLGWWFRPIKRDEMVEDILTPVYNYLKNPAKSKRTYHPSHEERCPHLLATLFMILAVGALLDLTLPPCSAEAEKYHLLGRAALSARSVFDSPAIEAVQAVALMSAYHGVCSSRYTIESAWSLISLASRLSQSIGLHRDSKQWKLDDKHAQRRRNLFWEIFFLEIVHCLSLGRPPTQVLAHIDCELPADDEQFVAEDGEVYLGYWQHKFAFCRDIYAEVVDVTSSTKSPAYAKVLDIDRRVRQMTPPPIRLYLRPDEDDYSNPALCMKSYVLSHHRSIVMIHIHRTFFAQALLDYPKNPLSSPFAPSFLAANRCASILLRSFVHHHERCSDLCSRSWVMWSHAFSSIMILGTTVIRLPNAIMAPSALMEIDVAVDVFKNCANKSVRARQALPLLLRLKEKAALAYSEFRNRNASPTKGIQLHISPEDQLEDELAIFGGQTRVLPTKKIKKRPKSQVAPGAAIPAVPAPASTPSDIVSSPRSLSDDFTDLHPSLMEYLSQLPSSGSYTVVDQPQHVADPSSSTVTPRRTVRHDGLREQHAVRPLLL
ncbi:hypothetical protein SCP_0905800 [Sparassis crispa]|uniref:Zn(2)-C6 fungal-type domain-containing protein n=1 Tax=Sparassis crispa TaxID=139825 RepID=A0A401GWY8_9APHY|nr:hypothetical protein SCP_0905800 [Sparassis crispa]GBE86700.1 hypothetical protein SCP_0905800 [Sparassis crispa]